MQHKEFDLQKQVCRFLDIKYPNVIYMSDTIANLKLTMGQKQRNKSIQKSGFHCPDLIILEPNTNYNGLFIELKIETPYKKDGTLKSQMTERLVKGVKIKYNHLEAQSNSMKELQKRGYYCTFAWDFKMVEEIIKKYINNEL